VLGILVSGTLENYTNFALAHARLGKSLEPRVRSMSGEGGMRYCTSVVSALSVKKATDH